PDVDQASEDDLHEDEDGDLEVELVGVRAPVVARVVRAGDAAEERTSRIRPRLRTHERNAHRGGGHLVLANRDPRATEPRVAQTRAAEDRHEDEHEDGPEVVAVERRPERTVVRRQTQVAVRPVPEAGRVDRRYAA